MFDLKAAHDAGAGGRTFEDQVEYIEKYGAWLLPQGIWQRVLWSVGLEKPREKAETVVVFGCALLPRMPRSAARYVRILDRLGIEYTWLDNEGCCGLPLLAERKGAERGEAEAIVRKLQEKRASLVREAGGKNVVYLCDESADVAMDFHAPDDGLNHLFYPDILLDRLNTVDLSVKPTVIGYHAGYHAHQEGGRATARFVSTKLDSYRKVLGRIKGLTVVDLDNTVCWDREPSSVLEEARELKLDMVVFLCCTCLVRLSHVFRGTETRQISFQDLLYEALGLPPLEG